MAEVDAYPAGAFCWIELMTPDAAGARTFYEAVLGWRTDVRPIEGGGEYLVFTLRGRDVAGGYEMSPEQQTQGLHPFWGCYVAVDDADAVAARAPELGGAVLAGPFDVMEHGRMAVLGDPSGAAVSIWQAGTHVGSRLWGEPGAPCWNELATRDPGTAGAFYGALFGWGAEPIPEMGYTLFTRAGEQAGGMMAMDEKWPAEAPPHWTTYIAVDDADATAATATDLGGRLLLPPTDSPYGRFAVVQDPQGAIISVIRLTAPAA